MKKHLKTLKWLWFIVVAMTMFMGVMKGGELLVIHHPVIAAWLTGVIVSGLLYAGVYWLVNNIND